MRPSLLLLVLLLLASAAGWLLLSPGDAREGDGVATLPSRPAVDGVRPEAELQAVPHVPGGPDEEERVVDEVLFEAHPAAGGYKDQPDSGLHVRVIARDTRVGVGKTVVYVVPASVWGENDSLRMRGRTTARAGDRYLSDLSGEVTAEVPDERVIVAAESWDRWGFVEVSAGTSELVLALDRFPNLRVVVTDGAGGRIPDLPIVLRRKAGLHVYDIQTVTSDERGEGVFDDVMQSIDLLGREFDYVVGLRIPVVEPDEYLIDPNAIPTGPVALVAPPLGAIEVLVLNPDRTPYAGKSGNLNLVAGNLYGENQNPPVRQPWASSPGDTAIESVVDGRAVFPFVAVGQRYELSFRALEGQSKEALEIFGPDGARETRTIEFSPFVEATILTGRILREDGTPVTDETLRVSEELKNPGGGMTSRASTISTDAGGRFSKALSLEWNRDQLRTLEVSTDSSAYALRVDLSFETGPGERDLGDLTLVTPPLVISGVVQTEAGLPLAGASIQLHQEWEVQGHDGPLWRPFTHAGIETDEEGRFEMRSFLEPVEQLQVLVHHQDYSLSTPAVVPFGSASVVLIVSGTGGIECRVLLDEGVPVSEIRLLAKGEEADERWRAGSSFGDDTLRVQTLPEGSYSVMVQLNGENEPLVEFDGVYVRAGENTSDPRLDPLDLRGRLSVVTLHVTDRDGKALQQLDILYRGSGARKRWGRKGVMAKRTVELVSSASSLDMQISAPNHRTVALDSVSGEREVVLQKGYPLRFVLAGGLPSLPEDHFIQLNLADLGSDGPNTFGNPDPFDSTGAVTLLSPRTGTFRLSLQVGKSRPEAGGTITIGSQPEDPKQVQILDSESEQVFYIKPNPEEMKRVLEQLEDY